MRSHDDPDDSRRRGKLLITLELRFSMRYKTYPLVKELPAEGLKSSFARPLAADNTAFRNKLSRSGRAEKFNRFPTPVKLGGMRFLAT